MRRTQDAILAACAATLAWSVVAQASGENVIEIGSRRELFVDRHLIDNAESVRLVLHQWDDRGPVLTFDKPWEGAFSAVFTVIADGDRYRLYYRGKARGASDGVGEVTCYAESSDGITWSKPGLGIHALNGSTDNNIIWMPDDMEKKDSERITHNFSPLLNGNPAASPQHRFLALGGYRDKLFALKSADGIHWSRLSEQPVLTMDRFGFDSQNVAFWSAVENKFVAYFRMWVKAPEGDARFPEPHATHGIRAIGRSESDDFVHWSEPALMSYSDTGGVIPSCHLYTNQTHPYFRAPHIYLATAARFMPGRQVLSQQEAESIGVDPRYFKDASDAVLMTTRDGRAYDRTFTSAMIRPGIGAHNWVSRTNYPALNIVRTGEDEMSLYVSKDYAQPTAHLRRFSTRLDGLASVRADTDKPGELTTKPLRFSGDRLLLNYATSAAGEIRMEVQDELGRPLPGFGLHDCDPLIGDFIERAVRWRDQSDVSDIAGRVVRLRFVMRDADVFALRFASEGD